MTADESGIDISSGEMATRTEGQEIKTGSTGDFRMVTDVEHRDGWHDKHARLNQSIGNDYFIAGK
ncbi:hypothetical protein [Marinobacter segnicrescens]|uniref:hypothetical protein n=2 Tax=Marinobacteraceae TaxID=2887365 RepID=UPI0015A6D052|nr:hypothetical protein [Marinobacter segnicrescens]